MRILIEGATLVVSYGKGDAAESLSKENTVSESVWQFQVFGRLKKEANKHVFDETNEWLATLDEYSRQRLYTFYQNCQAHFELASVAKELTKSIRNEIKQITDIFDLNGVADWVVKNDIMETRIVDKQQVYRKEELAPTTYSTPEAFHLSCMSIMIKLLTPIWGKLCYIVKNETSNNWKERAALETVLGTDIEKMAPFQRLAAFCSAKAVSAKPKMSSAAVRGMTGIDLEINTLACVLVRLIAIADLKNEKDIVQLLYKETITYMDSVIRPSFRDKATSGGATSSEDDGMIDEYRKPQDTVSGDRAMTAAYLLNATWLIRDMEIESADPAKVARLAYELAESGSYSPIAAHTMTAATVYPGLIGLKLLHVITDRLAICTAISAAYYKIMDYGLSAVAQLLISEYKKKDLHDLTAISKPKYVMAKLSHEADEELKALYPLPNEIRIRSSVGTVNKSKAPATAGHNYIDIVVDMISTNDFAMDIDVTRIRFELVDLLKHIKPRKQNVR